MESIVESCVNIGGAFGWADYLVLGALLTGSCLIGLFYSCTGSKQTTTEDFLLGGSSMGTVPTALSLAAGYITAIELLGNPSEMYSYGSQFWMICFSFLFVVPITSYLYLPVFMKLRLTSAYEYLELRFSRRIRVLAATMYVLQMTLYTSVAVYAPALALNNVTGLNTYIAVTVVYLVCIFYSSQGGMKAVIMTDMFQAFVLLVSIIIIMVVGNHLVGGIQEVYDSSIDSERLEFFNFWSVVIGGTFYWATMFCSNQASVQKYMSVETIRQARRALWTSCLGLILVFSINFYTGAVLYEQYRTCDPERNKEISAADELLPYYVMKIQGHLTGIPGLFVSGIFAASLGTVAAAVNSLAAVSMKDIIGGLFHIDIPQDKGAMISRYLSIFFGLLSFALVFVVEQLGRILQVALSFNGIIGGITLGLFSLGMFFPWANSKGAMTGGIVGLAIVSWMGIGAQYSIATGYDPADHKITSVTDCLCNNSTTVDIENTPPMWLYRVSYMWYSAIGCLITFILGSIVSIATNPEKPYNLNEDLISPPVKTLLEYLPTNWKTRLNIVAQEKKPKFIDIGHLNLALSLESEK